MATITLTIPDEKVDRVLAAFCGKWEKPDGYTDAQWAKEKLRQWVISTVYHWELQQAKAAITVNEDDGLIG